VENKFTHVIIIFFLALTSRAKVFFQCKKTIMGVTVDSCREDRQLDKINFLEIFGGFKFEAQQLVKFSF
jgi:hypothetical protein